MKSHETTLRTRAEQAQQAETPTVTVSASSLLVVLDRLAECERIKT